MNKTLIKKQKPTAVDDVRRVRQAIADRHKGDLHQHREETNRIFAQLRTKLKLKTVGVPQRRAGRSGA